MRRLLIALALVVLPTFAFAQEESAQLRRNRSDWTTYADKGCVGGTQCRDRRLRVSLEDRPVLAVRFSAHDQIGTKADGVLRVKIDGNVVKDYIDIPRKGETFTVDVDELTGRYLLFEPVNDDEVEITDIAVLYGRNGRGGRDRDDRDDRDDHGNYNGGSWNNGGTRNTGWRSYGRAGGCIGGTDCRKNGNRITIALDNAPVLGVRLWAHDNIGTRADGRLTVRIDDTSVAWYVDVKREGRLHEFDVDHVSGSRLIIETANDDEVEIKNIEVLYGRAPRHDNYGGNREVRDDGKCIGGDSCGGKRARIRIAIDGRAVDSIRLYARDDIGTRAGGELRIRIDDEIVEDYIDIPREGKTFTIDGHNIAGDYLYIEPASDDEVEVKDVRVVFKND